MTWERVDAYAFLAVPIVRQTVKAFDLEIKADGKWKTISQVRGNIMRHVCIRFDMETCEAIRISVLETHGDPSARIFEVRIY